MSAFHGALDHSRPVRHRNTHDDKGQKLRQLCCVAAKGACGRSLIAMSRTSTRGDHFLSIAFQICRRLAKSQKTSFPRNPSQDVSVKSSLIDIHPHVISTDTR